MTDAVTTIVYRSTSVQHTRVLTLAHTSVFLGGGPPGGGSLPSGGETGDVLTKKSSNNGDAGWSAPTIPWNSTNW